MLSEQTNKTMEGIEVYLYYSLTGHPPERIAEDLAGVLGDRPPSDRGARHGGGVSWQCLSYKGYTPQLALVMPDFIGFLRSELWGSKNAFTSGHS